MIPWRITLETTTLPDQIINKLAEITDTTIDPISFSSDLKDEAKKKIKFGGKVSLIKKSFRLFLYPYEIRTYKYGKTIYQGRVVESGGKAKIILWIRPSLIGLFVFSVFSFITVSSIWLIFTGEWNEDLGEGVALLLAVWAFFIYLTLGDVRDARKVFDSICTNKPFSF